MKQTVMEYTEKIAVMREGGEILSRILRDIRGLAAPGVRTDALDARAVSLFETYHVEPAFLGYRGFPKSICTSVNEEVVHGIPGSRILQEGDILSIDIGLKHRGFYSDMAITVPVGDISEKARHIVAAGRETLNRAVAILEPDIPLRSLSSAIQECAESRGYNIVRKYVGHTIGEQMHLEPQIPNFVSADYPPADIRLIPGMVVAIEPMLTEGSFDVNTADDGWTVRTRDRKLSVHFEYSVAVLEDGVEILTDF